MLKYFSKLLINVHDDVLPGRRKQTLDGGDEDEHDEGANQVGLEHLIPHLGVLHREREGEEEEAEGGRGGEEGKMERQVFRLTEETDTLKSSNTPSH